jgi:hypothetical protein
MTMHGIRQFSMGLLIVLSTSFAGAQSDPVSAVDVAPPPAPVLPKNPADMSPKAPRVTCKGDQITISADNSTLDAILAGVRGCTGAKVEMPEGASRVRSFEELGPGPVREVLDQLLSGTPYNYVIQSSDANPLKVESVVLSARGTDKDAPAGIPSDIPMTVGRRAWTHMQKFDKPDPSQVNADGTLIDPDTAAPAENAPVTPQAEAAQAGAAQTAAPAPDAAPSESAAAQAPPVTPVAPPVVDPNSGGDPTKAMSDRISAMQQMFDQRQKMIQKQNQSQTAAPN